MKKYLFLIILTTGFAILSGGVVKADEGEYHYFDTSMRDDAARDEVLHEESADTWASKPPHEHTVDDAYDHAVDASEVNPLGLIRDQTQNSQTSSIRDSNLSSMENNPSFQNRNSTLVNTYNSTLQSNRHEAAMNARDRQSQVQNQMMGGGVGSRSGSYQSGRNDSYQSNLQAGYQAGYQGNQGGGQQTTPGSNFSSVSSARQSTPQYGNRDATRDQRMNEHQRGPGR